MLLPIIKRPASDNLANYVNNVRRLAHEKASQLYIKVVFSNTPQTSLDICGLKWTTSY